MIYNVLELYLIYFGNKDRDSCYMIYSIGVSIVYRLYRLFSILNIFIISKKFLIYNNKIIERNEGSMAFIWSCK